MNVKLIYYMRIFPCGDLFEGDENKDFLQVIRFPPGLIAYNAGDWGEWKLMGVQNVWMLSNNLQPMVNAIVFKCQMEI